MSRRYKTYAAETGVSYQYFYEGRRNLVRPEGQGPGCDFTFVVTANQRPPLTLKVFLSARALDAWRKVHGQELDANEQYAAAKMRLFRAFDEHDCLVEERLNLVVDEGNIEELLEPLSLA